jgi:hypothetical protein
MPGLKPGCCAPGVGVIVRWIGAAGLGAVLVGGGAEKVREPRLPAPPPIRPPILASASPGAKAISPTSAKIVKSRRLDAFEDDIF